MKLIIVILLAIALLSSAQAQEDGLVAEWHFDDGTGTVLKDSSGNGNDGTIYGATWVDGKFGKALSFDGVDDYVETSLKIKAGARSIFLWIKYDSLVGKRGFALTGTQEKNAYTYLGIEEGGQGYSYAANVGGSYNYFFKTGNWYFVGLTVDGINTVENYVNGIQIDSKIYTIDATATQNFLIGRVYAGHNVNGIIDEVRIFNRALSAEEIKTQYEQGQTALTAKKEVSPYSIRQQQTTNVTIQIKNTGTSEIRDIEVVDSMNSNLELIGGDFPNPKKYNSLSPGESRDIRYILKSKESGTFILNPATVSYSDSTGNIKVVKSEPISLIVIPSSKGATEISSPSEIGTSSAVLLHGEKTDVVLGEDILLKLSAVNLITKPPMSVQVMIYPPSGMSVTGSEFVKSGAGIYTTTYTLNPGDGKDIEVHIKSNQVGDFNVKGRIVYYFGEEKEKAEDHTLNLPIKVRKEAEQTAPLDSTPKTPGFAGEFAIIGILFVTLLIKRRG